jgi:hypothetical protein
MGSAEMVYKTGFRDKVLSTSICGIEVSNIRLITDVKRTTDESFALMSCTDMDLEISRFGELFVAAKIGAQYLLSFFQRLSRMLTVDMILQLSLA